MPLAAGSKIGPYEIVARLGAGGMGEVYRVRDTRLARDVAIKRLVGIPDQQSRARVLAEARAAAALNHPNICTLHEIAESGDELFLVMECVEGQPLADIIGTGQPPSTVVRYGKQMAAALAHAHDRGIAHRDLKSANVMVTADGRVKVLDFGVAGRLDPVTADTATRTPTLSGSTTGTPAYMAPEALRGQPIDPRSDLWALGIVLYELLEGRRPFEGSTVFDLSSAILRDEPAPLSGRVPAPLRLIVQRCLSKESAARYQRAGEVLAALEAIETLATPKTRSAIGRPRTSRPIRSGTRIRSLAVLPLDNMSRKAEQEYFADGITEALIGAIAQIEGLRVISRTSSMRLRGTQKAVREIARDLNVQGIVTGSVRRAGDRVRVSAELVDAATEAHLGVRTTTETSQISLRSRRSSPRPSPTRLR
jgi:serine/threonine protein kinase